MTGVSADLVGAIVALGVFVIHLLTVLRAITRPNRTPASRVAWVATIMCLPVIGVVAYLFLGETSIGHERVRRLNEAEGRVGDSPIPGAGNYADDDGGACSATGGVDRAAAAEGRRRLCDRAGGARPR